ncbi:MAG TPA: class I SAM-dependent methyltransferase [Saprospiraceae bacterium]|nr:class I SAM-dependent methyltransferase [Saprospiraceae bacterium]HPN68447.1 class I SAM-dependent methyltransferase [Saprospiraceae bacterium]
MTKRLTTLLPPISAMRLFGFMILICCLWTCKEENIDGFSAGTPSKFDPNMNAGRSSWQKPSAIIDKLGDLSEKVVADIGAGSGFFSFRIAMKAAKVIAIDIDKDMIDLINLQKMNMPGEINSKIETRLVGPQDPAIKKYEVDVAVIVNTITYINNRQAYLKKIYEVLPQGGKLMIVDFKTKNLPIDAPPISERIAEDKIVQDLHQAGFKEVDEDNVTLEYQYIIIAEKK